jgi:hypothetical protein
VKNDGTVPVSIKGQSIPSCATVSPAAPAGVPAGTTSSPSTLTFSGCTGTATYSVKYGKPLGGVDYECTFDATFNGPSAPIAYSVAFQGNYASCSVGGGHPEIFQISTM